jgi:hypothetical protein
MPFAEAVDTSAAEVQAAVAVPKYYAAYEKAFELPVHRPVKVIVVCDRSGRLNVETDHVGRRSFGPARSMKQPAAPRLPSASTIGANRAGGAAAAELMAHLGLA